MDRNEIISEKSQKKILRLFHGLEIFVVKKVQKSEENISRTFELISVQNSTKNLKSKKQFLHVKKNKQIINKAPASVKS